MFGFDDLPAELVLMILAHQDLTRREYHSLLLTSRRNAHLVKPFLYANISTDLHYQHTHSDDERPLTALTALVVNLARHPENTAFVKFIRLEMLSEVTPVCMLKPDELETLDALTTKYLNGKQRWSQWLLHGRLQAGNNDKTYFYPSQAPWAPLVTILLALCSRIEEIVVAAERTLLDPIQHMVLNSPHKFPALQRVTIDPSFSIYGTRHGNHELILQDNICWARCPNLKQFSVRGAGCDLDRLHTREDDFDMSNLECGLREHQNSLVKVKIDLSQVHYASWRAPIDLVSIEDTFKPQSPRIGIGAQSEPYTMGIGSLAGFKKLRELEISLCVLGVFRSVQEVVCMLPPNLESLVLLGPVQPGQMPVDDVVDLIRAWRPARLKQLKIVNHVPVSVASTPTPIPASAPTLAKMATHEKVTMQRNWVAACSPYVHGLHLAGGL
ncbi:hypothetical protein BD289DRAFT_456366 [Coniella lustricola]|uniref:Uncharacterized protein n=1 Tax=Coniella lustricola TaxID=2025994 RepID=A0A2T2ZW35_9PEZI|nr:hypothetical protein BD289DRAFT_456366 [Coniella lustricola]